jgi:ubiquinol-cytochrome c reductase iron-sulfur subunit
MPLRPQANSPTSRRSFVATASLAVGAIAFGAAGWALLDSLSPSADVLAAGEGFDINLSEIPAGSELWVKAYGLPIVLRHRTPEDIAAAEQAAPDQYPYDETLDVFGRRLGSAEDRIRRATPDGRFIALVGRFQEFDCVPLAGGDYNGWFEPCRGNHYDTSGRFRKGASPENLRLPVSELVDANTLRLVTNPNYVRQIDLDALLYR